MLDDIPGIGRRQTESPDAPVPRPIEGDPVKRSVDELAATETMNMGSAKQVYDFFHPNK